MANAYRVTKFSGTVELYHFVIVQTFSAMEQFNIKHRPILLTRNELGH